MLKVNISNCRKKRSTGLGIWDDSPRFFDDAFGSVMSKTMFTGIHPDEDRYVITKLFQMFLQTKI